MLYSDDGPVDSGTITLSLNNEDTTSITASDGSFSKNLTAPSTTGEYTLQLTYGDTSVSTSLIVSSVSSVELALLSTASESYEVLDFSNTLSAGITSSGSITGTLTYGNFTNNNIIYFAILQQNAVYGTYDTLFISQDADFSTLLYQDVIEGSKISLSGNSYSLMFVDPLGGKAVLTRELEPVFYGTGSEWVNLLLLALNSSGSMLTNLTNA
jgi:hypothetical protein